MSCICKTGIDSLPQTAATRQPRLHELGSGHDLERWNYRNRPHWWSSPDVHVWAGGFQQQWWWCWNLLLCPSGAMLLKEIKLHCPALIDSKIPNIKVIADGFQHIERTSNFKAEWGYRSASVQFCYDIQRLTNLLRKLTTFQSLLWFVMNTFNAQEEMQRAREGCKLVEKTAQFQKFSDHSINGRSSRSVYEKSKPSNGFPDQNMQYSQPWKYQGFMEYTDVSRRQSWGMISLLEYSIYRLHIIFPDGVRLPYGHQLAILFSLWLANDTWMQST